LFSSRRRHTRSKRDWSSDVCSSDLNKGEVHLFKSLTTRLFTLLFLCGIVFVSACSSEEPEPNSVKKEEVNDREPTPGGTIVGAMYTTPAGKFNPIFYDELYEAKMFESNHETNVNQNEDLEYIPKLAKEWEVNDDQTEITLFLKKEVTWHDGEPFTAEDVVFTYQAMSDPDYVSAGGIRTAYVQPLLDYEDYASGETDEFTAVVAEDDHTVTFKFEEPNVNPLYPVSFRIIP